MEGLQAELEQCKQQNRDLENTLAQANEEQEALAAQLYETGHALDEANNEVTILLTAGAQSVTSPLCTCRYNVKRMNWVR